MCSQTCVFAVRDKPARTENAPRWEVPRQRHSLLATLLVSLCTLSLAALSLLSVDKAMKWTAYNAFYDLDQVRENRFQVWRNPPAGAGDRPFMWGMAEENAPRGGEERVVEDWLSYYPDLGVDLVRVFTGWIYHQPAGRHTSLDPGYHVHHHLRAFQEAGLGIQAVVYQNPRWGASHDWGASLAPKHVYAYSPPIAHDDFAGPYADYLALLHAAFPAVRVWQIWNEPDYPRASPQTEWNPLVDNRTWRGTARQYGELVGASATRLRALSPHGIISTGGVSDPSYLAHLLKAPEAATADVYDVHFAAGLGRPNVDWELDKLLALVAEHKRVLTRAGVKKQHFSVSELSFAYNDDFPDEQAGFLAKVYAIGKALGWDSLTWWGLSPYDPVYYRDTGLVHHVGVQPRPAEAAASAAFPSAVRPAYLAYRFSSELLKPLLALGTDGDGEDVRIVKFARPEDGGAVWLSWTLRSEGHTLTWPAARRPAAVFDIYGKQTGTLAPGDSVLLSSEAVYLVEE